jgi:hypothetical protein
MQKVAQCVSPARLADCGAKPDIQNPPTLSDWFITSIVDRMNSISRQVLDLPSRRRNLTEQIEAQLPYPIAIITDARDLISSFNSRDANATIRLDQLYCHPLNEQGNNM